MHQPKRTPLYATVPERALMGKADVGLEIEANQNSWALPQILLASVLECEVAATAWLSPLMNLFSHSLYAVSKDKRRFGER